MSEGQNQENQELRPGFCSATCVDMASLREENKKPELRTSDMFATCKLPKRFEHPHWFNGYGCQVSKQHPFYRTSASVYGWYPPGGIPSGSPRMTTCRCVSIDLLQTCGYPYRSYIISGIHSVPSVFFPAGQTFTNRLSAAGMYRNYSLNTGMDPAGYT